MDTQNKNPQQLRSQLLFIFFHKTKGDGDFFHLHGVYDVQQHYFYVSCHRSSSNPLYLASILFLLSFLILVICEFFPHSICTCYLS